MKHTSEPYAISAWLRQGENLASQLDAKPYSDKKLKETLPDFKDLMTKQPTDLFIKLQELCLEVGINLVHTPCLAKAPVEGSARWVANHPLIQLSEINKINDKFWFNFFHELGHILLHGKKYISIASVKHTEVDLEKEKEADGFAVRMTS